MSRFLVGIDLGTTHTVVAFADLAGSKGDPPVELFEIEQLVAPGEVGVRPLLPSLRYHPAPGELAEGDDLMPWSEPDIGEAVPHAIIGSLAREMGSRVPGRLVASAKSWLSHPSVDRTAPILPWGADDVPKVSPVIASASYLAHVSAAWLRRFPRHPLEQQELVLTVPASFDEAARALTLEAARRAGMAHVRLVEEPQAACYDWLGHQKDLKKALGDTRLILVCDVGGGTTDLTLISVEATGDEPMLSRIGVGDHLMLGGDNMDLALAHVAESRLLSTGGRLKTASLSLLVQQCRTAKERLLGVDAPETATVTVLGTGAKLIGDARSTELTREEVRQMVVDGFFPLSEPHERPQRLRGGIVEFGLSYAADPAVSRHIAEFLDRHTQVSRDALKDTAPGINELAVPDAVLLNGGVFQSATLSTRTLQVLSAWRGTPVKQLQNEKPELAVARGAVAYGMACRGKGLRIGGGSARSYFLLIDGEQSGQKRGVCLLPHGTPEGIEVRLGDRAFALRLRQPVQFHLASSTGDTAYVPGQLEELDDKTFKMLPPLATLLGSDSAQCGEVRVELATVLTEVGTLEMNCVAKEPSDQRWRLEFQLRGEPEVALAEAKLHPRFTEAAKHIVRIYGSRAKDVGPREAKSLRVNLEKLLGPRETWDTPLLRELFNVLWQGVRRRRRSADHERLWLHLTGYCLRPGYGFPLDDWRVQQLWEIYDQGVQFVNDARVWAEWWTLWRRTGGGLDEQAQLRLLDTIALHLEPLSRKRRKMSPSAKKMRNEDMVRLAGSLERVPVERKVELGTLLIEGLRKPGESSQWWWTIGRLGARVPFYGSAHSVVPRDVAAAWLEHLLQIDWREVQPAAFAATLLARMSGDRERDLEAGLRTQVWQHLRAVRAPVTWQRMVQEVTELNEADEGMAFGESLPPGLRLVH